MKSILAGLVLAAGLIGASPVLAADCNAVVDAPWTKGGPDVRIEAFTRGATCATAVAVFTVRGADGALMHYRAFDANFVLGLAGRTDGADMEAALKDWTDQERGPLSDTANLPEWKAGADAPEGGEFPFLPAEGIDRDAYEQIRAAKVPLLCFAQGTESLDCLALIEGQLQDVGLQLAPG